MNFNDFLDLIVPICYFFYGVTFLRCPPYKARGGFSTKRAQKSEEIWNYVQKTAGIVCFVFAVLVVAAGFAADAVWAGGSTAKIVKMAVEGVTIVLLIPVVNLFTRRKFPDA